VPEAPTSPITPLPSSGARLLAFLAIVVAGVCGGLIGYSVTELQCRPTRTVVVDPDGAPTAGRTATTAPPAADDRGDDGGCPVLAGAVGLGGAALAAGGVAVIAVLVLRAMGEWRQVEADTGPG
jgi:hypothetical protein